MNTDAIGEIAVRMERHKQALELMQQRCDVLKANEITHAAFGPFIDIASASVPLDPEMAQRVFEGAVSAARRQVVLDNEALKAAIYAALQKG